MTLNGAIAVALRYFTLFHFTCVPTRTTASIWTGRNNLKLNQTKSVEVIFTGRKQRQQAQSPAPLPGSRFVCKELA